MLVKYFWNTLRCVSVVGLLFAFTTASGLELTREHWSSILNLSGRQRMLTQKMTKELLLVVAEVDVEENRKNLRKTVELFDLTLNALLTGQALIFLPPTTDPEIVSKLQEAHSEWEVLKPIFQSVADGKDLGQMELSQVVQGNRDLLESMNAVVDMYELQAKPLMGGHESLAVAINLAGRQRMLSQRISKQAILIYLGIEPEESCAQLKSSMALFVSSHRDLVAGSPQLGLRAVQGEVLRQQFLLVEKRWQPIEEVLEKVCIEEGNCSAAEIRLISGQNVSLLEEIDIAVKLLEKRASRVSATID